MSSRVTRSRAALGGSKGDGDGAKDEPGCKSRSGDGFVGADVGIVKRVTRSESRVEQERLAVAAAWGEQEGWVTRSMKRRRVGHM